MKKQFVVCAMLVALAVTLFAPAQKAQAATAAKTATEAKATEIKAPTIKVTLNSNGVPVISWKKVSGANGYRIYRQTATDKSWVKVVITSKTSYTDKACKAEDGSTVKYIAKSYVKVDGKTTWSAKSKAVSVKIPEKSAFTYKVENGEYHTYLDGKLVVSDFFGIPSEYADMYKTLEEIKSDCGLIYSTYYYYDDKYVYQYSGGSYYIYVSEIQKDGSLEEVGVYDEFTFSPNYTDGSSYLSYEDSLESFKAFQEKFLAGKLETVY